MRKFNIAPLFLRAMCVFGCRTHIDGQLCRPPRTTYNTRVRARYLHFITITPDDARHHQHITHCDIVCAHMAGAGFACKGHLRTRQSARLRTARRGLSTCPGDRWAHSRVQPEMLSARHVCQHLYSHIAPSQLTCALLSQLPPLSYHNLIAWYKV